MPLSEVGNVPIRQPSKTPLGSVPKGVKRKRHMSYFHAVTPTHPLCGTWLVQNPGATSFYDQTEYSIWVADGQFRISAIDLSLNEAFSICDVRFDGEWIEFTSLIPSTGRTSRNWMRVVDKNKLEFHFSLSDRTHCVRRRAGPKPAKTLTCADTGYPVSSSRVYT